MLKNPRINYADMTKEPNSISIVDLSANDDDPLAEAITKTYILDSTISRFGVKITYDFNNDIVWINGGSFLDLKTGQHLTFIR